MRPSRAKTSGHATETAPVWLRRGDTVSFVRWYRERSEWSFEVREGIYAGRAGTAFLLHQDGALHYLPDDVWMLCAND